MNYTDTFCFWPLSTESKTVLATAPGYFPSLSTQKNPENLITGDTSHKSVVAQLGTPFPPFQSPVG